MPAQQADDRFLEQVVSEEDLVRPLPRQDDLDAVLAHQTRQQVQGRRRGADEGSFGVSDHVREYACDVAAPDPPHRMLAAHCGRDGLLVHALVEGGVLERHRERPQHVRGASRRQRAHDARVDAATQIATDGHVGL